MTVTMAIEILGLCGLMDYNRSHIVTRFMEALRINCFLAECVMVIGLQQVL